MSTESPAGQQVVRVLQIIHLAMTGGVVVFAAVAVFLKNPVAMGAPGVVTLVLCAVAASNAGMALVVPGILQRQLHSGPHAGDDQPDETSLAAAYQTQRLVAAALLEGGAFCGVIAYFLEQHVVGLVVAGVLTLGIVSASSIATAIRRLAAADVA